MLNGVRDRFCRGSSAGCSDRMIIIDHHFDMNGLIAQNVAGKPKDELSGAWLYCLAMIKPSIKIISCHVDIWSYEAD